MIIRASGPPFWGDPPMCKCGWKWASDCKSRPEHCGLVLGMPKYEQTAGSEGTLNWVKVGETIEHNKPEPVWVRVETRDSWPETETYDASSVHTPYEFLSEDAKKAAVNVLQDMIQEKRKNAPMFTGWENTEPVTYLGTKESPEQVGGTHYAEMSVQPWDAMRAWMSPEEYAGYHVGTVIGYLSRHKKKGSLTDIKKAKHHLEELVRYFEEDEEYPW